MMDAYRHDLTGNKFHQKREKCTVWRVNATRKQCGCISYSIIFRPSWQI